MIVYPGNTQGRNRVRRARAAVIRSMSILTAGRISEFVDTSVARWVHLELSIATLSAMDQLIDLMLDKGRTEAAAFDGPTVVRCTIRGNGVLHRDLQRDGMHEELAEILSSVVVPESVRIATGPELDLDVLASTETMVSDFLRLTERALADEEMRRRLADSLSPLFRRKDMPPLDDGKLREWIQLASAMGVDLLLDS